MNNDIREEMGSVSEVLFNEEDAENVVFRLIEALTIAHEQANQLAIKQIEQFASNYCLDQISKNLASSEDSIYLFLLKILNSDSKVIKDFFKAIDVDNRL